jgi:hypothetical protein
MSVTYPAPFPAPPLVIDDERELDQLEIDQILRWMSLIFDTPSENENKENNEKNEKNYKQELYNIYMTLASDYKQYQHWKRYNSEIWIFSSYRKKDTKYLAKKVLSGIKLFNEGLKMFTMFYDKKI